jgi:hypothetical protein
MGDPASAFVGLPAISLAELEDTTALQTRIDRKYMVDAAVADLLVGEVGEAAAGLKVLEINGRYTFDCETLYFDTPHFALHRDAAHSRRRRFKVRTRSYGIDRPAVLEVKTKSGRGETIKVRSDEPTLTWGSLSDTDNTFIAEATNRSDAALGLGPVLTTRYQRATLVGQTAQSRLTIDRELRCEAWERNDAVAFGGVVLETKSAGQASVFDRWLWRHGHRPVRFSKCSTALALIYADLPSNKWHRTMTHHFSAP